MIHVVTTNNGIISGQDLDAIISRVHGLRSRAIAQSLTKLKASRTSK